MQGHVGLEDADGGEAGVDLAIVNVSAQDELEMKRALKMTKSPSVAAFFHQNSIDHVNTVMKFEEGL